MANYSAPLLQGTVSSSFKTAGALWSSGVRRLMVYEIEFGQTGGLASTDCQVQWDVSRFGSTAAIVGAAVVPNALDIADSSPLAQYTNAVTTELTYTGAAAGLSIKSWAINQRGSYRWRALDDGDNLIIPATAGTGLGVRALSASFASTGIGSLAFVER